MGKVLKGTVQLTEDEATSSRRHSLVVRLVLAAVAFGILASLSFIPGFAAATNLHLIDSKPGGFAIYRSGKPSRDDFKHWCKLGIQEVYVLSGNADEYEDKYAADCPSIKVLASEAQDVNIPPDDRVFNLFDSWVQDAMAKNKKILFRCNCGCHRTGRLAAYYQMKYQNLTAEDAIAIMNAYGSMMAFHPELPIQVREMEKRIRREKEQKVSEKQIAVDRPELSPEIRPN